jgi:hypothetical protein
VSEAASSAGARLVSDPLASPLAFEIGAEMAAEVAALLVNAGASHVSVGRKDYVFAEVSPLFERLESSLKRLA